MKLCKKIFGIATLAFIILVLVSGTVLAAYSYYATIQVQETGDNDYDYLPIIAEVDNNYLVANGYMSLTGLDTRVLSGSVPLEHLVAYDKLLFVAPSVGANSKDNYRYTLGNSLQENFPIIVGYGGYITVSDDSTMEPGSVFELIYTGYIDTASGATQDLIFKSDAIRLYVSGDEQLTCSVTGGGDVTASGISSGEYEVRVTTLEGISSLDEQIMIAGCEGLISSTYDNYMPLSGSRSTSATFFGDDIDKFKQVMTTPGTFKALYVELATAPGTGDSWDIDLLKNDVATDLDCTISESATQGYNLTDTADVAAGDTVQFKATHTVTPASSKIMRSIRFAPDNAKHYNLSSGCQSGNANTTHYYPMGRGGGDLVHTTFASRGSLRDPFPTTGTIKNLYIDMETAPGVGTSYTYTVLHWDASASLETETDLEVTVAGSDTTGNDTTHTIDVDIGDSIYLKADPSDTDPTIDSWSFGVTFVADNEGETPIFGYIPSNPSGGYVTAPLVGKGSGWTPGTPFFRSQLAQDCVAKDLYVQVGTAPGDGNQVKYSVQRNGIDILGVTISNTDKTGNNTLDTMQLQPWDYIEIQFEVTQGSPVPPSYEFWSFVLQAQGAGMRIYVDSDLKDTDTVVPTVLDNDNDWIIMSDNSTPYLLSLTMEAYDIPTLSFQKLESMLLDDILDDQTINGNDGTITWGVNPVDLSATMGSLISSSQPSMLPASEEGALGIIPEGEIPAGETVNTALLEDNPLYPIVQIASEYTNYTEEQIWFIGATIIILIGMGISAVKVPSHLLLAGTVGLVLAGFFTAMQIYQWWMMLIFGFVFVMSILMERKPVL